MFGTNRMQGRSVAEGAPSSRSFHDADGMVQRLRAAFADASEKCISELREVHLTIGGQLVRLKTIGVDLHSRVKGPLAHLETSLTKVEQQPIALTIELWDELETGVGCAGFEIEDALDAGKGFVVTVSDDSRYVSLRRARLHAVYDRLEGRIIGWSRNGDRLSLAELGRPMQYLFYYWFHDVKLQLIHSGMIGENGAGIIVAGRSGSGKSTTSLVCLEAGMNYLGDDVLVMSGTKATGFIGHSVYNSNHILPRDAVRFPHLKRYVNSRGQIKDDKWVVMLHEAFPGQVLPNLPIRAIALPRIVDQPTSAFRRATKAQALMAIAPSSITLIEGAMSQSVTRLAELVEHVPSYWVDLGRDFRSTPGCIRQLISQVQ